ncbi:MAG: hypothetical protein IT294_05930 [Deltaproteobacteria bacterium]|nr:hypothetical protein [Deltaproteobacteria bacterium]
MLPAAGVRFAVIGGAALGQNLTLTTDIGDVDILGEVPGSRGDAHDRDGGGFAPRGSVST